MKNSRRPTCGDFGGITLAGELCNNPATGPNRDQRCKHHPSPGGSPRKPGCNHSVGIASKEPNHRTYGERGTARRLRRSALASAVIASIITWMFGIGLLWFLLMFPLLMFLSAMFGTRWHP